MFTKREHPDQILLPIDAMSVVHPDLPLWIRHRFSVLPSTVVFKAESEGMSDVRGTKEFVYVINDPEEKNLFQIAFYENTLTLGFDYRYHDAQMRNFAQIDISNKLLRASTELPVDSLIIDRVDFSFAFENAFKEYYKTKQSINAQPITDRILYFMFTGIFAQSAELAPNKELGITDAFMRCVDSCTSPIVSAILDNGKSTDDVFFLPQTVNDTNYLLLHPEVSSRLQRMALDKVAEQVPSFVPLFPVQERDEIILPSRDTLRALPPPPPNLLGNAKS
jgi:hypothetical protein